MQERDFLEAIAANPDDDTAKLVYADWLDEQGDLRGQLIRLAVEMEAVNRRMDFEFAEDLPQLYLWKHLLGVKTGPLGNSPIVVVSDEDRPSGYRLRVIRAPIQVAIDHHAEVEAIATAIRAGFTRGALRDVLDPPPFQ